MSPGAESNELHVMSAGAARGLVGSVKASYEREASVNLTVTFGTVGTIRELLATDAPCDVLILTPAVLEPLATARRIDPATRAPLGLVHTGIAVRQGAHAPAIDDAASLRDAMLAASALFVPDPERATAGIHCVAVLKRMGIAGEMARRLRPYAHGVAAMEALAQSRAEGALGCTQVTEIEYTQGVTLVGTLPPPFELSTLYSVAVTTNALEPERARAFAAFLAGPKTHAIRRERGFDVSN
jgi:molybdate transport system substrate-binding protein